MSIKKSYEEIVAFLEKNQNKKVDSILPQVYLMAESKKQSTTHLMDGKGNPIAVYCWYHKQWEIIKDVPYGSKANTATKLNTMCKVGTSKWTKKQTDAKSAKAQLLEDVASGKVEPKDIIGKTNDIEVNRIKMDKTDMPKGFASEEEVTKELLKRNPKVFDVPKEVTK